MTNRVIKFAGDITNKEFPGRISINVSTNELARPNFADQFIEIILSNDIRPEMIA